MKRLMCFLLVFMITFTALPGSVQNVYAGAVRVSGTISINGLTNADIAGRGYNIRFDWYRDYNMTQLAFSKTHTDIAGVPYTFSHYVSQEGLFDIRVYLDMDKDNVFDTNEPYQVISQYVDFSSEVSGLNIVLTAPPAPLPTSILTGSINAAGYTREECISNGYIIRRSLYHDPGLTQKIAEGDESLNDLPLSYWWTFYVDQGQYYLFVYMDKDGDGILDEDEPRQKLPVPLDPDNRIDDFTINLMPAATLQGSIRSNIPESINGISVQLFHNGDTDEAPIATALADETGNFEFRGVTAGDYTVVAENPSGFVPVQIVNVSVVEGEIKSVGELMLVKVDLDGNNRTDIDDLMTVALSYGSVKDGPGWDTRADLNCDGRIDEIDLKILNQYYGHAW